MMGGAMTPGFGSVGVMNPGFRSGMMGSVMTPGFRVMPGFQSGFNPGFNGTFFFPSIGSSSFRFNRAFFDRDFDGRLHRDFDRRFDRDMNRAFDPRFGPNFFRPF
jgi:hypothetical protein